MKESDIEHLRCIYERISTHVRKDNDYMIKFKSIIDELEKENMPKTKRWRLEIPKDHAHDILTYAIKNIANWNDATLQKGDYFGPVKFRLHGIWFDLPRIGIEDIPESWLVEIKEEKNPIESGEEYMCGKYGVGYWDEMYKPQQVIDAFHNGEQNQELKHQETESMSKSYVEPDNVASNYTEYCRGWKAANKSRGYKIK